jgi:hypothetical protein
VSEEEVMERVFVHHDEAGNIVSVAVVRVMSEGLEHPFLLLREGHGAIELPEGHPARALAFDELVETHQVDPSTRVLRAAGSSAGGRRRKPHK